ncbi:DNA-binding transcriptional LysR family regulator [Mycetocola sp. BIGb0189]|uniref:LysR family transcriptional regulator n=1 Tax=Mycetocola sp. BIGb0189 TaxID=2940604 RepID=UPI0021685EE1|nr:LysR family transcriptional regulator [Mycetocola sp. BIGb0189]MCS4276607.1 DNA-binding transcriptional LysR family regulator [Mycetocola sp. BIGb0189]
MEIQQLRAFVKIVDCGSFTGAARSLHVTQAALSHAIKAMERRIGAPVLNRRSGPVTLTPAGRALLPHARAVVLTLEVATRDLAELHQQETLRIASLASAAAQYLPGLIQDFRLENPTASVDIYEGDDAECLALLRDHRVDIALIVDRTPHTRFFPLYQDDFVLVTKRQSLPAFHVSPVHISELEGSSLIESTGSCRDLVSQALGDAHVSINSAAQVSHIAAALLLITAGLGSAILPRALTRDLPEEFLRLNLLPPIVRTVGFAVRDDEPPGNPVSSVLRGQKSAILLAHTIPLPKGEVT